MKIGIASDHKGYLRKEELKKKFDLLDYGTINEESVDYIDYAKVLCNALNNKEIDLGILICGTGIGMSIVANKIKGIRCAKVDNKDEALLARSHNNANVLAISSGKSIEETCSIVETFINTPFSNEERHIRRMNKINNLE